LNEGVEWALHSCLNLGWTGSGQAVSSAKLARLYGLPAAYLNKQLQALVRAGILASSPGPRGGFRLARPLDRITLLDVVVAIEGPDDAFRCTEILRETPDGSSSVDYRQTCVISQAMREAELAWRRQLGAQTLADIAATVQRRFPGTSERAVAWLS
jgi:Rrf2 family protein